ncbi:jg27873 [Pararge aegeria aegeria]|uniref:Jg27873 protein n=1 Tax=Pararge aegeria aegeria TaxID=348720 RepID=A0A8S4RW30_9NEOP|nr:jg27873 [Pararge aegeria aegeria]
MITISIVIGIIISTDRRPLLDIGLLKGVPNSTVLCRLCPAAPRDLLDVVCPPCGRLTNAALTSAGRHSSTLGPQRFPSYVPHCHFSFAIR